jgi:anti-anti-sigma factor
MGPTGSSLAATPDSVFVSPAQWDAENAVVWLRGDHDLSTIRALSATIFTAIAHDDADLTLDLSEVLFIDAAAVGAIVRVREFLRLRSRTLSLRSPSRRARRILELCDLTSLIEPSPMAATGAAGSAAAMASWVAVPVADPAELADVLPEQNTALEAALAVADPAKQLVS